MGIKGKRILVIGGNDPGLAKRLLRDVENGCPGVVVSDKEDNVNLIVFPNVEQQIPISMTSKERHAKQKTMYEQYKAIKDKLEKGEPTTFKERTVYRIVEKKKRKSKVI